MFKKAADAKSHQRLSGADGKKLRRSIRDRFPNVSDAQLQLILPPKAELAVSKYPNRVLVYGVEGDCPMFFDVDGRGHDIFPTVYALWKVPEFLPSFVLKGGEVSRFVIGGADLMFPGISISSEEEFPKFSAGEPWAVKVPGNPAPIAVGTTTMSSTEALKAGLRGKALKICHYYRDTLWESAENRHVPNGGFLEDVVFEDPLTSMASESSEIVDLGNATNNEEVIDAGESALSSLGRTDEVIDDLGELKVAETHVDESNAEIKQPLLSVEEVDILLDKCLLQALHTTIKEKDLPIIGSTLWSNHVLPCRPPDVILDVKKSSHKKLAKWLQAKASGGLISVKEDKHKKEMTLISVNRKHPDYMSFKPEKERVEPSIPSSNEEVQQKTLELSEIYKPSVHVNPIFASVGADTTTRLYTASEASDVVFQYVEKENLVKPSNKSIVTLDATLCDALFKGTVKKGSTYPTEIHKKDLGRAFVSRMQAHHSVTRGNNTAVRKGALKPIQIMTERRQGNKKMTKLSGVESFLLDAEALASELQKKCACSTTVAELPGKKGQEVLVQGGVIDDLARYLVDHYGVPKRYIEVLDKTKR